MTTAGVLVVAAGLAACGDDAGSSDGRVALTGTSPPLVPEAKLGRIVKAGFGQSDDPEASRYVWVTALVENLDDHAGHAVTVVFKLLDDKGHVIANASHVGSFSIEGQTVPVGTEVDVGEGVTVAAVDPTVLVDDNSAFPESDVDLGAFDARTITYDSGDATPWGARFTIENPTDRRLESPTIGIICLKPDGSIIGGGSASPRRVPPGGQIGLDPDLITSGKPAECRAYVAPGPGG